MSEIPNTELLKRFAKEVKMDERIYSLYLRGTLYPNYEEFHQFLKLYEKGNLQFGKMMKRFSLIRVEDQLLETVSNPDFTVSEFLTENPSHIVESKYGVLTVFSPLKADISLNHHTHYISNGIYEDSESIARRLLDYGAFTIGVCGDKNSVFYEENRKKMEQLLKEFHTLKKHSKVKIYRAKGDHLQSYFLHYRRQDL